MAPVRDSLRRFGAVRARLAEPRPDAELERVFGEQARLQDTRQAVRGWELDRTLEIGMAASVDPTREALDGNPTGWEAIGAGEEALTCGRRPLSSRGDGASFGFRRADQSERVRDLSGGDRHRVPSARLLRRGAGPLLPDQPPGRRL